MKYFWVLFKELGKRNAGNRTSDFLYFVFPVSSIKLKKIFLACLTIIMSYFEVRRRRFFRGVTNQAYSNKDNTAEPSNVFILIFCNNSSSSFKLLCWKISFVSTGRKVCILTNWNFANKMWIRQISVDW